MFFPKNRVKLERDRCRNGKLRDWTIEEVWLSLPNWIKPMMKQEKTLKEGLEKLFENQDNMVCKSAFAFLNRIGCPPFFGQLKVRDFIGLL
jgi:hypothetical protein